MKIRLQATQYIWVAYALTMVAMFASMIATGSGISAGYVVIAAAASIMAFLSTGMVWNWGDLDADDADEEDERSARKRKNNAKLQQILARLSDEERDALREKLDSDNQYGLSDDGELVKYQSRYDD